MDFKSMPKVELHVHLDGSIRPETVAELLNKDIESIREEMIYDENCKNLNDYLTKFDIPIKVMQEASSIERIAYELGLDLVTDGIVYAEVRFAPFKHIKSGLDVHEVIDSVLKGFSKVNIKINLLLCMMRDSSFEENKQVIDLAVEYKNKGVVGIDLAGAEAIYKTSDFKELFKIAYDLNIPYTIHAGEADGVESIKSAIDMNTNRIGHGVRIIEDLNLIEELKSKNILLEICPTSNIQTGVYETIEKHPIKKLYDLGCLISINTDNNTVSNINLSSEYEKLYNTFNFTLNDFNKINEYSIKYSFADEETKNKILNNYK